MRVGVSYGDAETLLFMSAGGLRINDSCSSALLPGLLWMSVLVYMGEARKRNVVEFFRKLFICIDVGIFFSKYLYTKLVMLPESTCLGSFVSKVLYQIK